jgi:diguanylate cyclase
LSGFFVSAPYQFWVFAALAVASEIVPFVAARFQRLLRPVFISVCFSFAILLVFDIGPAVVVQIVAVLGAWLRLRINVLRILAICLRLGASLAIAGLALHATAHHHFGLGEPITGAKLGAVLAAVGGWFAGNYLVQLLFAWARQRSRSRQALRQLLPYDVLSNAALLMLAPSLVSSPSWVIALLVVPLIAVGQMARMSGEELRQARIDPVTGLLSRRGFMADVQNFRLDRRDRILDTEPSYAVMLLDLDRFKEVNDAFGHEVGDRLLAEVGRRLSAAVRPGDLVSRLGGDEFVVVATRVRKRSDAAALADRIRRVLAEPTVLSGLSVAVGHSIGVALYPDDGEDLDTVMRHADSAMYAAKHRGGGVAFYEGETATKPREGLALLSDVRRALDGDSDADGDRIGLRYQPEVSVRDRSVVGVEAQLDFRRSTGERVDPDEIFRIAQHTPGMHRLTEWVVARALDQLVAWSREGHQVRMSINVSVRDLETTDLVDFLAQRVRREAITPELVALSVDESTLMAEPNRLSKALGVLSANGIELCLDGFGTGRASIEDLRRLPVNGVKIDRALVGRMTTDPDSDAILAAAVNLGHTLELRLVAKGVDSEATHRLLAAHGCPIGQGSYYAAAMTAEEFGSWLDDRDH